jgi:hypothetical protein
MEQISSRQLFATVSGASQAAASAAIDDDVHVDHTISLNEDARSYLETELEKMNLEYVKSATNFMMIDVGRHAGPVVTSLMNMGYQVRTGWGMPQYIRVSTGTMEEMEGFIGALRDVLNIDSITAQHPGTFGFGSISPNPFSERCKITFYIPQDVNVRIVVYDVNGKPAATLLRTNLSAGRHSIPWDGKDQNGKRLEPGIYTVLLVGGELASSRKVSMVY